MSATFRDRRGRLRAAPGAFPPLLADFLETDVRDDPDRCGELRTALARARGGEPFEAFGNLYVLSVDAGGAVIRNAYDHGAPPLRLSLSALEAALAAWCAGLASAPVDRR
ncbi:MAG: hypothetical protein ACFCUO_12370 [Rhodospirillales bacterium]